MRVQGVPGGIRGPGVHDADDQVGLDPLDVMAEPDEQPDRDVGHECPCWEGVELAHGRMKKDEGLDDEEENGGKHHDVVDGVLRLRSGKKRTSPPKNSDTVFNTPTGKDDVKCASQRSSLTPGSPNCCSRRLGTNRRARGRSEPAE